MTADTDSVDDILDESSISENENDLIKLSEWDSCAKPVRSALKSPDKSSSVSKATIFFLSINNSNLT